MADPDWTDPCAVLAWLRPLRFKIKAGLQEIRVAYKGRDIQFSQANIDALDAFYREVERDCAAKQGDPRTFRRRAFRFG